MPIEKEKIILGSEMKSTTRTLVIPQNAFCSWGALNEKSYEVLKFKVKADFIKSDSLNFPVAVSIAGSPTDPVRDGDLLWVYSLNDIDLSSKSKASYEVYFYAIRINLLFQ